MKSVYKNYLKPILFRLEPELAHKLTVETGLLAAKIPFINTLFDEFKSQTSKNSQFVYKDLVFKNRVGLAAGFDKNALLMPLMEKLGFSYLEIGSITAQASEGNPKRRLFRIPDDNALINRMGLNNDGAKIITERIFHFKHDYPIGINIAKTHSPKIMGESAILDYVFSFELAEPVADYITLNISCPNTEEGKTFEDPETLNQLLSRFSAVRKTQKPVLVKLSVDLDKSILNELLSICENYFIDGYVCSNTSSKRENLKSSKQKIEEIGRGGLSGAPIFKKSVDLVSAVKSKFPNRVVIGVGGIDNSEKALEYLKSGADLIQIYSGLIYYGPTLVRDINLVVLKHFN